MKHRKLFLAFLVYALALAALGFISDKKDQPDLWVTAAEFLRQVPLNDPLTFLKAGIEVANNGWLLPESSWIFRLWPPGFVLLLASFFKFFGTEAPFLTFLFGVTVLFGANMLLTVYCYLTEYVDGAVAFLLPLAPFLFPVTRFFLLQPLGLSLGEGFSIIFFLTAVFCLLLAVARESVLYAFQSAVFFALSAYFRSQYELLVTALLLFGMALWIAQRIFIFVFRKSNRNDGRIKVKFILIAIVGAQLFMLPWRVNNYLDSKTVSWVRTQELVARNSLMAEDELLKIGGDLVVRGGGDLACRFEPTFCNSTDNSLFYRAFFQNPKKWIFYKASLVGAFWYPSLEFFPFAVGDQAVADYWGNSIIAVLFFASFFLLYALRKKRDAILWFWILSSVYGALAVVLLMVQFEVRYFFLAKILALFSFSTFIGVLFPAFMKGRAAVSDTYKLRGG